MNRSRLAFALGLLAAALLLGGCSDDPVPKVAPASESASASESQSPTGSKDPVAAVRAWVAARNHALQAGDTGKVEDLSAEDCKTCYGLIDPIKETYAAGGHFETTGWKVVKAKQRKTQPQMTVAAGVAIAGGVTVPKANAAPNKYPPENHLVVFKLRREADHWVVGFIGFLS